MMFSSLRLIVLERVAHLLRRWLHSVTAQLPEASQGEPSAPLAPPAPRPVSDPHRPPPPDHWVELVQQYAPQLLEPADSVDPVDFDAEPEATAEPTASLDSATGTDRKGTTDDFRTFPEGKVVNYRKGAPKSEPATPLHPVPLQRSAPRPVDVAKRRSAPRPLRLEQVSARSLAPEEIAAHTGETTLEPPLAETILPSNTEQNEQPVHSFEGEIEPPVRAMDTDFPAQEVAVHTGQGSAPQVAPSLVRTTIRPVESGDSAAPSSLPPVTSRQKRRVSRLFSGLHLARHKPAPTPALPVDVEVTRREVEALELPKRRPADLPAQPIREIPTQANTGEVLPSHVSPNLSFERQRIREIDTSVPNGATVPTIRTGMGQAPQLYQGRTSVPTRPAAPPQTVLRPTLQSLNLDDVSPDRWPSLPDEPAETPRDPSLERQRRERLNREQEGGTWNE